MNLDELISKYLDGELTPAEDLRLRALIKEDPAAKSEFDAAVLVCMALKEDAKSINTPDYVYHSVEDAILMEIMKAAPGEVKRANSLFVAGRRNSWALMFALTLIGGALNISRIGFEKLQTILPGSFAGNISVVEKSQNTGTTYKVAPKNNIRKNKSYKSINSNLAGNNVELQSEANVSTEVAAINQTTNNNTVPVADNAMPESETQNTNSNLAASTKDATSPSTFNAYSSPATSANSIVTFPNSGSATKKPGVISDKSLTASLPIVDELISDSEVQATSFFGTDVAVWGGKVKKTNAMNTFSQAISYSVSPSGRLGLEFGYSDVKYQDYGRIIIRGGNSNKIEVLGSSSDDLVLKVEVTKQTQIYWGGFFYENSFNWNDNFSVTSRLGFGATNDGPLAFARVYAKAKVYGGIYLTAGSDIRSFYAKFGASESTLNSAASIVYGLQFKF